MNDNVNHWNVMNIWNLCKDESINIASSLSWLFIVPILIKQSMLGFIQTVHPIDIIHVGCHNSINIMRITMILETIHSNTLYDSFYIWWWWCVSLFLLSDNILFWSITKTRAKYIGNICYHQMRMFLTKMCVCMFFSSTREPIFDSNWIIIS